VDESEWAFDGPVMTRSNVRVFQGRTGPLLGVREGARSAATHHDGVPGREMTSHTGHARAQRALGTAATRIGARRCASIEQPRSIMGIFQTLEIHDGTSLHVHVHKASGLRAIVALHSTRLGPAIGGCRCLPYGSSDEAVVDAIRLARGMSYKAAISGLPHGGGKAVIMLPQDREIDRVALFTEFARFVDTLGGAYITCEDSGTSPTDMGVVAGITSHVLGTPDGSGDPSPMTAFGVRRGIEAAVAFQLKRPNLDGVHVAIQGVGHVGYHLARELVGLGARITVADVNEAAIARLREEIEVSVVDPNEILSVQCDVLAPCALGAVINDETLPSINALIVAGAANNVLAESRHGDALHKRGILYAPDYAINAGGLMNVAVEFGPGGYDRAKAHTHVASLYDAMMHIFERAASEGLPTHQVADLIAEERIFGDA